MNEIRCPRLAKNAFAIQHLLHHSSHFKNSKKNHKRVVVLYVIKNHVNRVFTFV